MSLQQQQQSLIFKKELEEQSYQQQQKNQLTVSCEYCKKIMDYKGYFYIIENEIHFFHDTHCKFLFIKRLERKKQKILKIKARFKQCLLCKKLFDPKFRKNPKYCSRSCFFKNRLNLYDKFYYCPKCKWIPKEEAQIRPKGSVSVYRSSNYPKNRARFITGNYNTTTNSGDEDIMTSVQSYQKYVLKRDSYYCPKCNERLVCKNSGNNKKRID